MTLDKNSTKSESCQYIAFLSEGR